MLNLFVAQDYKILDANMKYVTRDTWVNCEHCPNRREDAFYFVAAIG